MGVAGVTRREWVGVVVGTKWIQNMSLLPKMRYAMDGRSTMISVSLGRDVDP